jgi:hypothetical protein
MTVTDMEILEALRETLAAVHGLRTVRLARENESVEIPLSRLPAAVLEPAGAESLVWSEVPAGRYALLHWRLAVLDRAVPGTRAFESLVSVAESCREAIAADLTLGHLAADGPPSARDAALAPAVAATRIGPTQLAAVEAGRPTSLLAAGASGYWAEPMTGAATLDGEPLFSSGPHTVAIGSPVRRIKDQVFNGLAGGLALDLGDGPRDIFQAGVLSAASAQDLALAEAAIEAFIDGRAYTLATPQGAEFPLCRLERFDRVGPPQVGTSWHQPYRITYRQTAR